MMLLGKDTLNHVVVLLDNASSDFDDRGGVVKMHVLHSTTNNIECREQAVVDAQLLSGLVVPPSHGKKFPWSLITVHHHHLIFRPNVRPIGYHFHSPSSSIPR